MYIKCSGIKSAFKKEFCIGFGEIKIHFCAGEGNALLNKRPLNQNYCTIFLFSNAVDCFCQTFVGPSVVCNIILVSSQNIMSSR